MLLRVMRYRVAPRMLHQGDGEKEVDRCTWGSTCMAVGLQLLKEDSWLEQTWQSCVRAQMVCSNLHARQPGDRASHGASVHSAEAPDLHL